MATLQIKIDDKNILSLLKEKASSFGLSRTAYVRMLIYSDINYSNIEAGLADIKAGRVSPTFENIDEAIDWLNRGESTITQLASQAMS